MGSFNVPHHEHEVCVLQVIQQIDSFLAKHAQVHVVLLPSTQDAQHHPVFPQPAFSSDSLQSQYPEQLSLLPNPATFACNEITVGAVTSDVLRHLTGQEVQKGPQGDRLPGLAAHLLGQQRCVLCSDDLYLWHLKHCFLCLHSPCISCHH